MNNRHRSLIPVNDRIYAKAARMRELTRRRQAVTLALVLIGMFGSLWILTK